jgi:Mlc titration factor MtfA (ptsG expression regulator)
MPLPTLADHPFVTERRVADFARATDTFLAKHEVIGKKGLVVTDEMRRVVAFQAAVMTMRFPREPLPHRLEVHLYPGKLEYGLLGEAWGSTAVRVSWPEALADIEAGAGSTNLIVHELALVIDHGVVGVRDGLADVRFDEKERDAQHRVVMQCWMDARMRLAAAGETLLRPYAGTNVHETFACAVEELFARPGRLARLGPELFRLLTASFHVADDELDEIFAREAAGRE